MGAYNFVDLSSSNLDLSTDPIFGGGLPSPDVPSDVPALSQTSGIPTANVPAYSGFSGANMPDISGAVITDTSGDSNGSSASGFLSGLGDLFQGVGAGVGQGLSGANLPRVAAPTGWVYNPTSGQYYNPATGQALTSTGTLPSAGGFNLGLGGNSGLMLIALAVIAIFVFRKK